jgi:hypothetical protein
MYWLVLNPECNSVVTLTSHIIPGRAPRLGKRLILEALELLQRRLFIDIQTDSLSPSKVWRDYIIERFK